MEFFWCQGIFFVNLNFKDGCKNEFQDNNEKSCNWFKNRWDSPDSLEVKIFIRVFDGNVFKLEKINNIASMLWKLWLFIYRKCWKSESRHVFSKIKIAVNGLIISLQVLNEPLCIDKISNAARKILKLDWGARFDILGGYAALVEHTSPYYPAMG